MTSKLAKQIKQGELQSQFNSIKQKQNSWTVITTLNKLYKVDRILLKHAYDNYPQKKILQNSKEYKQIQKFYKYVLNNLFAIEKDYLTDDLMNKDGQNKTNYEINKNSTSKFIRDQKQYYLQIFGKFAQKINQEQYGINGQKIYDFVKSCFDTPFTQVIINGEPYFSEGSQRKQQFQESIKQYYVNTKDIQVRDFVLGNVWMEQSEILDFLSHWLKENQDNQLYVLYCRTEEKLKKDALYLKSLAKKNKVKQQNGQKLQNPTHPITLQNQQLQHEIQIEEHIQQITTIIQQPKEEEKTIKKKPQISNIMERIRKNKFVPEESPSIQQKQKVKVLTKKQQLMMKISEYFIFGCKRRYPLPKGTTFDQIQSQSKTMNLQKFINFCNHFEINKYLSRQLLSQIFKINALNRLTIDQKRFIKIIQTIIETDSKCVDCFFDKKSIQNKLKQETKLSHYKFMLRPVNGKSIEELQRQIHQKKLVKSKSKQQKLNLYFLKKMKAKEVDQQHSTKKQKAKSTLSARLLPESTSILQLQNMRDDRFDPQKFFGDDHDELLNLYESKFQSRNQSKNIPSTLQSILSKRLQKGNKVIQKMNSQTLKYYQ